MLRNSNDKGLARYVTERTMAICMNVMTLIHQPMTDSVYGLTSNDQDGSMILMNGMTSKQTEGFFAISNCRTTKDRIIVTTKTTINSCTMTCFFQYNDVQKSYSFYDQHYSNESLVNDLTPTSNASVSISKPIPIRPSVTFQGVDFQTP